MNWTELYITLVGVVTLRLLIFDNLTYLVSCAALGIGLGMYRGLSK